MSLGQAVFDIKANTDAFVKGMVQAQSQAQKTTKAIEDGFRGLQIIPRQLAAINQSVMNTTNAIDLLTTKIAAMKTATGGGGGGGGAGFGGRGGAFGGMGMGLMMLAQTVDDVQYGFRAIVNNIPMMSTAIGTAFGMSTQAALAFGGTLGIVAVAINQVIQHWDVLSDAFRAAWSGSTIEQLQKVRQAAEEAAATFDKLAKKPTEVQAASKAGIEKAIVEGPMGRVLEGIMGGVKSTKGLKAELGPADEAEVRARTMKNLGLKMFIPGMAGAKDIAEARAKAMRDIVNERDTEKARGLLGNLGEDTEAGKAARQNVRQMALQNPGAFPAGFAGDIERMEPEELKRQAKLEEQGEQRARDLANEKRLRDEEQARMQQQKEWEIQGRKNAIEYEKKLQKKQEEAFREAQHRLEIGEQHARQDISDQRRIAQIMKGAMPEPGRAQFMGHAEFQKFTSTGILNNAQDIQRRQLEALQQIREILADRAAERNAGNRMAGAMAVQGAAIAIAGGPP